jgi:hypothetical protein
MPCPQPQMSCQAPFGTVTGAVVLFAGVMFKQIVGLPTGTRTLGFKQLPGSPLTSLG